MIRITGGKFRGRSIETPPHMRTRPTTAKVRQALFNSIQGLVEESKVLDLFSGPGTLGFEALSRGAKESVFVESDRVVAQLITKNAKIFKVEEKIRILTQGVFDDLSAIQRHSPFDLVFCDPPYGAGLENRILESLPWSEWLVPGGHFILEWSPLKSQVATHFESPFLVKTREKKYGDTVLTHFQRN